MHSHEPRGIVEQPQGRLCGSVASTLAERLHGGRPDVRIGVTGQCDETRLAHSGIPGKQSRSPKPDCRVIVGKELKQLATGKRSEALQLRRHPRPRHVTLLQRDEQEIDRPLVSEVPEGAHGSRGHARVGVAECAPEEAWRRPMAGMPETAQRGHPAPSPPIGAGLPARAAN